jgi:hypothetical protein
MSEKKTESATGVSQSQRYLVIEARWYEPFLDRFVFALRDGESLHDGIAGISVVGIGFGLCEATAAVIANSSSGGADSKNKPEKLAVDCDGDHRGGQSRRQGLRHRVGLTEPRRIAGATLQYAIAASVLMFYSKTLLGAALRALVGG